MVEMDDAAALAFLNQKTTEVQEGGSPLQHFFGKLYKIKVKQGERDNQDGSTRNVLELRFMFSELNVIKSRTPYIYPTGELPFFLNNPDDAPQPTSRPGIWFKSINDIQGQSLPLAQCIGKTLEVEWTDGHDMKKMESPGVFSDYQGEAFVVVSINGARASGVAAAPSVPQRAANQEANEVEPIDVVLVRLAEGQNHTGFMGAIVGSDRVKAEGELHSEMLKDNGAGVVNRLITEGKMVNDEGIYHAI